MATMDGIELSEDELKLAEDTGLEKYIDYGDSEKEEGEE